MDINNLTEEQAIELLNTDFGPELEKQASAFVEAEEYVEYGEQLALEKIAAMEESYDEGNYNEADQEKIASADVISEYIQQGFVETMMKMGSANYNDELIYLEEMAKEAGKERSIMEALSAYGRKGTNAVKRFYNPKVQARALRDSALKTEKAKLIKEYGAKKSKRFADKVTKQVKGNSFYDNTGKSMVRNRKIGTGLAAAAGLGGAGYGLTRD